MASFSRCSASRSRRSAASSAVEDGGGGCCGGLEVRILVQDREVSASILGTLVFLVFVLRALGEWNYYYYYFFQFLIIIKLCN